MERSKKMYVTAEEAAVMLGVSIGYAYRIIRGLNEELKVNTHAIDGTTINETDPAISYD